MKNYFLPLALTILLCITFSSCQNKKFASSTNTYASTDASVTSSANNVDISDRNNPIDNYFYTKLETASAEVERRDLQNSYYAAWKAEFENVISYLNKKCKYQQDKDQIVTYAKRVQDLLDASTLVIITDWGDVYNMDPKDPDRNPYGNGTLSGLNEYQAKIYRDASINIINRNDEYKFIFNPAK